MSLNHNSAAHLDQYAELQLLFTNNGVAVGAITSFSDRAAMFAESLKECYTLRDTANGSTEGFTTTKNKAKKTTSKAASAITGKGNSYGILTANTVLQGQMTQWTENYIYRTKDIDFAGAIENVYTTLNPFITSDPAGTPDYFTTPQLDAMQKLKDNYVSTLSQYKNALSTINVAKGNFTTLQIPIMEQHILFLEGFLDDLALTYPDFVTAFKDIIAKLASIGKRNQGASALMMYADGGKVINLVGQLQITNYPKVKVPKVINTNTNGVIELLQLKIGTWDGVFSAPNCIDQKVTIKVEIKKITAFIINMVAKPVITVV